MTSRLAVAVAVWALCTGLSGCFLGPEVGNESDMTIESENCRAASIQQTDPAQISTNETLSQKEADFDRAYRACMAAKGFPVASTPSQ